MTLSSRRGTQSDLQSVRTGGEGTAKAATYRGNLVKVQPLKLEQLTLTRNDLLELNDVSHYLLLVV